MTQIEAQNQIIEMQRTLLTGETLPGIDNEHNCVLQGPDNEKCSIGVVLYLTDTFDYKFEGESLDTIFDEWFDDLPEVLTMSELRFCHAVQNTHDNIAKGWPLVQFRKKYYDALESLCRGENLTFPFTPDILEN